MDYPFFVKPIADVPDNLVRKLADIAVRQEYGTHPHFSKMQPVTAYMGTRDFSCELGRVVKAELLPLIPMDLGTVDMWEVNRLGAGESIYEHSDIASQSGIQGSKVVKSHKIHIPLITNLQVRFGHRRSLTLPMTNQLMPTGKAYAYNNYVWHEVHNGGLNPRYQMTIRFWDPDWIDRAKILSMFQVPTHNTYELEEC